MRLIVIGSNSKGNSYALDNGKEILLVEAGVKLDEVKKAIGFRLSDVVGCIISHSHGDHCKYASDYAKNGIVCHGPEEIAEKKKFGFGEFVSLPAGHTFSLGGFDIVPFDNFHDVPILGYIIRHDDMGGSLLFSTDTYKIGITLTGVRHFLIEANYSDELLKENVWNGTINQAQADRIMLSHMSLNYCLKYLSGCEVEKSTRTITLCHLSSRNSNPELFEKTIAGTFAIPCYIAEKNLIVELN